MKQYILAFVLLMSFSQLNAQKNTFEFGLNKNRAYNYFSRHVYKMDMISNSIELGYYRSISNKFDLFAQYTRVPFTMGKILVRITGGKIVYAHTAYLEEKNNGKLLAHLTYNFFDLGTQYRLFQHKQHKVSFTGGISLAYGTDEYLENSSWIYGPGYPEMGHAVYIEIREEKAHYWGGFAGLKYDYLFWKNRINIGPEFAARYYTNGFPYQFSYGLHVGLNF